MSRENIEAIRQWVACYNARDIPGLLERSDPEIEFRSIFAGLRSGGVFKGFDGVAAYFAEIDDAYERFQLAEQEYVDAGAGVLLIASCVWQGKGSGAQGETPIYAAFWIEAGKVVREKTFTDRAEGFAALGLEDTRDT